jgi:N-hydroxyarylamine O-acetyltransferase
MGHQTEEYLEEGLLERVLDRLEIKPSPPSPELLGRVYHSWCHRIPFDNVLKIIHVRSANEGPLPGSTPDQFFENWLLYATGGTCWAGAGALHALLVSMGFDASRALGTMLVAPDLPPNHGSVQVNIEGEKFLLDTSILHGEPLLLREDEETAIEHQAWGVRCSVRDGRWHVGWRPLHKTDGFECRFESFGTHGEDYATRYEATRGWSPFNYQVCARRLEGDDVIGIAFGNFIRLASDGKIIIRPLNDADRSKILIEQFGMSEEIIGRLPGDIPTPPPPGSHAAAARG